MNGSKKREIVVIGFVTAIVLMVSSPLLVSAQSFNFGLHEGPFVDEITYKVISNRDAAVLSLINDDIDLIGDMVDPTFLSQLQNAPNIEVANVLRNGYGYVTIKTNKYPLNITAFRRALAFALDKERISAEVWNGLSVPQDSVVPQVNPFSIEGQMPYTYHAANVELGNQLLDNAGFNDVDVDGWREAPNGQPFSITVECAITSPIATQVGEIVAQALRALKVNAISKPTDFYEYLNRLYFHGDYDIVFLGASFNNMDVDWLAYEYWGEYADRPYYNFPCWRNASYDAWRPQLLYSTEFEDVLEAAHEMQKIWIYESPMIICYENILLSAYRTDRFAGYVNDVSGGVPGWWTNFKVHLTGTSGPFGGNFRWSNPLDLDTFNFMVSSSAYTMNVLGMMYDSLLIQDPTGLDIPWLAESYVAETHEDNPQVPEGHTRFTFHIVQNATWTDGTPLTAEDVAFSLNYFRDAPGCPYGVDLADVTAAYAPTAYTLVVEFKSQSYWHLHSVSYKPVIPKHIYEEIGPDNWNTYNPHPPAEAMVTSGPFNVSQYVQGEFCKLRVNINYFHSPRSTIAPVGGISLDTTVLSAIAGVVGAVVVIVIGGYLVMRKP
ncbi:MAG: ABC transporter substrate-binding protein [Candidatus Thorarchaeota archaeon]